MGLGRLALVLSLFCFSCKSSSGQEITVVNHEDMLERVVDKEVQLVDVRTTKEYEAGHIGDAINFNISDGGKFLEQIKSLNKYEPVYLYCKSGVRSKRAAKLLQKEGFTQIFDYSGGYDDWKKSKY
ncbi:MAG: rhodanese-like domain-containing protein [Bacteroidota bacterium]